MDTQTHVTPQSPAAFTRFAFPQAPRSNAFDGGIADHSVFIPQCVRYSVEKTSSSVPSLACARNAPEPALPAQCKDAVPEYSSAITEGTFTAF